tara:strand:- start:64 stop:417 length:354 start_codon:yes stop_codon:yes gene_type:complete
MAFSIDDRKLKKANKKLLKFLNRRLPKMVLKEFKNNTPKDGGNARRKTKLNKTVSGFKVTGNYPYSDVIDKGKYPNPPKAGTGKTSSGYSTQAPKGIIDPTIDYTEKTVNKHIRRIG